MAKTRLQLAKPEIIRCFEALSGKIIRYRDISRIVSENSNSWNLAQSTTIRKFIQSMLKHTKLRQAVLVFPGRRETRYFWGEFPEYQLALSLKRGAYFTHYTAMSFHDLTDQLPRTIYLNVEQPPKRFGDASLAQGRMDAAFKRKPRISNNVASYGDYRICILNGMHTGGLGVIEMTGPDGSSIRTTNIERTLIDITVRPFYAGGVFEVLNAFKKARNVISIQKLVTILQQLNYIYPYRQAIGFYLDRAGVYLDEEINMLRDIEFAYDFYLTYQIKKPEYSSKWRLFFPKGL